MAITNKVLNDRYISLTKTLHMLCERIEKERHASEIAEERQNAKIERLEREVRDLLAMVRPAEPRVKWQTFGNAGTAR